MQDGPESETTEEVEPTNQRIVYINTPQPVKYCSNKIRYLFTIHHLTFGTFKFYFIYQI